MYQYKIFDREPQYNLDCVVIASGKKNSTWTWKSENCSKLEAIVPICQYPYTNMTEAMPDSIG